MIHAGEQAALLLTDECRQRIRDMADKGIIPGVIGDCLGLVRSAVLYVLREPSADDEEYRQRRLIAIQREDHFNARLADGRYDSWLIRWCREQDRREAKEKSDNNSGRRLASMMPGRGNISA